jgi:hypothetical protein
MSLLAAMMILFGVDRPATVPRAPSVQVARGWPYKE